MMRGAGIGAGATLDRGLAVPKGSLQIRSGSRTERNGIDQGSAGPMDLISSNTRLRIDGSVMR